MLSNRLKQHLKKILLLSLAVGSYACQQNDDALLALEGEYSLAYFRANGRDTTLFTDTATGIAYKVGNNNIRFQNDTYKGAFNGSMQDAQLPLGAFFQGEFYFNNREYLRPENSLNLSIFPREITLAVRTAQIVNNIENPTDTISLDTIDYDFGRRYLFNGIWSLENDIPTQAGGVLALRRRGSNIIDSTTIYEMGLRRER